LVLAVELGAAQVLQTVVQVVIEVTDKQFILQHQQLQILATAEAAEAEQDQVVLV
jgi:hypothetical protein